MQQKPTRAKKRKVVQLRDYVVAPRDVIASRDVIPLSAMEAEILRARDAMCEDAIRRLGHLDMQLAEIEQQQTEARGEVARAFQEVRRASEKIATDHGIVKNGEYRYDRAQSAFIRNTKP